MDGIVIQCGYCRNEHFAIKRTDIFCCSRCHALIPVQTREVHNGSTTVSNRSVKTSPLQKIKSSSENLVRNGNLRSPSGSPGIKFLSNERRKASFSMFNACPRVLCEARLGKRALVCGVSYKRQKYKLKGTLADVRNMKHLLMYKYDFPEHVIRVLTEEENPVRVPTKANMEEGLRWLVEGCRAGDSLVFYFSGHGLRQPDFDDDELDGFDETLCPVDFKTKGMIFDNDLNNMIVKPLTKGVTLHAITDACHSGTILDLEYLYSLKERKWLDNRPPSGAKKCTNGGRAICFSACRDDEMATDSNVQAFTKKAMSGVMTHCFIQTILTKPKLTYAELVRSVGETIMETFAARCFSSKLIDKLLHRRLSQEPQLSSSEVFDVESTKFML